MIFNNLHRYGNKIALISDREKISYNKLISLARKIQINKNKLILILSDNNIETLILYIASIRSKSSVYLVDFKCDDKFLKKTIDLYQPEFIAFPKYRKIDNNNYKKYKNFRTYKIIKIKNQSRNLINDNLAILLTTSGTTGTQKLAKLSYKNITSNAQSIVKYLNLNYSDCSITTLPIYYSYGLSVINSHLYSGAKIVLNKLSILENEFWNKIRKLNITNFSMVPFFFDIIKRLNFDKYKIEKLKFVTLAGGKLDKKNEAYFNDFFFKRKIKFIKMYGATEASPRISYLKPRYNKIKIGSIGKAIPKGKLLIKDKNGKNINKPNVVGEISYIGPNIFMGYSFSRKDLLADKTPNFLNTGDLGYFDKDGFFYITGRKKRFAKIFGHRINLDEIEQMNKELGFINAVISDDKKIFVFLKKKDQKKSTKKILEKIKINSSYIKFIYLNKFPINQSSKINYEKLKSIYK